jgi:hypothetical protein
MLNSKSLSLRTSVFTARAEALLTLALMAALILLFTAHAKAESTRHTRTSTTTTVESDDDGQDYAPPANAAVPPAPTAPAPAEWAETEMSQTFGSKATTGMAGCKTEVLSKDVIKDLKRECSTWVKEQKKDLGKNYLGNTCEDSCDDCGMNLVRCKITGTIRYRKFSN